MTLDEKAIRILVVDDHELVREGICSLLEHEPNIEIVSQAPDGETALVLADKFTPDCILMDIAMPGMGGLEATRQLKKLHPGIKVIGLSVHDEEDYVVEMLRAGASGYVLKQANKKDFLAALHCVCRRGEIFLQPSLTSKVVSALLPAHSDPWQVEDLLTPRELEILEHVAKGYTNQEIAKILSLSIRTVHAHRANIIRKAGVKNIAQLVEYSLDHGLINLDDNTTAT